LLRSLLRQRVRDAVLSLVDAGNLPAGDYDAEIADPKQPEHGDFATNFALAHAKRLSLNPRELAERLAAAIKARDAERPLLDAVEIAGPGFINLRLKPEAIAAMVPRILELGEDLPRSSTTDRASPLRLNVEYVSVNPNGPITVGSGRGAAFGSTLCNVLEAAGHKVHREYYINDGTNSEQMRVFAVSVREYVLSSEISWMPMPGDEAIQHQRYIEFVDEFIRDLGPGHAGEPEAFFVDSYRRFTARKRESPDPAERQIAELEWNHHFETLEVDDRAGQINRLMGNPGAMLKDRYSSEYIGGSFEPYAVVVDSLGYKGDYVAEIAAQLIQQDQFSLMRALMGNHGLDWIRGQAETLMTERQRDDLSAFATTFHTWFSEQSLHDSGKVQECVEELIAKGAADEKPYQLEVIKKKGEPDKVLRNEQPVEEEEIEAADAPLHSDPTELSGPSPITDHTSQFPGNTLWLRSTKFADDKDRVLRRKDGRWTYIASDVAYHKSKFERGSPPVKPNDAGKARESSRIPTEPADKLITILGPDHHGYIGRLRAVVAALLERDEGQRTMDESEGMERPLTEAERFIYSSPEERDACLAALEEAKKRLDVVIFQIVRFVKDGKPAPMRKRDGNIYSLRDLMLEIGRAAAPNPLPGESASDHEKRRLTIGKDVARFFYLMRSHDTHMDFDLDLAERQSEDNPVYYVQYAHARICSVLRRAEEAGFPPSTYLRRQTEEGARVAETSLLRHPRELALIKTICDLPHQVQRCAEDYGVHRLTAYAQDLARAYHLFYDACRVIQPEQPELTRARLALCEAARIGLKSTFELLGISAPERMERDNAQPRDA
jgi:arginyl-tRNA synthetase